MRRKPILHLSLIAWAIVGPVGCLFQRTSVNPGVGDLDTSFIEVGRTEWSEVFRQLGPPDVPIKSLRVLKYTHIDGRMSGWNLGVPSFFFLPFRWFDSQRVEEILIELDERGVVTDVVRSTRDTVRPPLQGEGSRELSVHEARGTRS